MTAIVDTTNWNNDLEPKEFMHETSVEQYQENIEDANENQQKVNQEQDEEFQNGFSKSTKNFKASEQVSIQENKPNEAPVLSVQEASKELSHLHAEVDKALRRSMTNFQTFSGVKSPRIETSHQGLNYSTSISPTSHFIGHYLQYNKPTIIQATQNNPSNTEIYRTNQYPINYVQSSRVEYPKANYEKATSQTVLSYRPFVQTSSSNFYSPREERKPGYDKQKLDQILSKITSVNYTVNAFKTNTQNLNNHKSDRNHFREPPQTVQNFSKTQAYGTNFYQHEKRAALVPKTRRDNFCGGVQNDEDSIFQHEQKEHEFSHEESEQVQENVKMANYNQAIEEPPRVQKPTKRQLILSARRNRNPSQDVREVVNTKSQEKPYQTFEASYKSNPRLRDSLVASPKKQSATHDRQFGQEEAKEFKILSIGSPVLQHREKKEFLASPKRVSATHYIKMGVQNAKGGSDNFSRPIKYTHEY